MMEQAGPPTETPTPGRPGGYMHLLPTYIPEGLQVSAFSVAMHPWLAPAHSGIVGTTSAGQPALAVTFEAPTIWLRTVQPLGKFEREWLYLRRYSADQALATGKHAFADVRPGGDPPDALATTDSGAVGVESTALTLQDRRGAHALFRRLRERLLQEEPARFIRLARHMIYVWFRSDDLALDRPPRRSEEDAVADLVSALADYTPATDQLFTSDDGFPQQAPPLPVSHTDAGATFYAVPLVNATPSTMLFTLVGFEIGLAYTSLVTAQQGWSEMQRLVTDHDKRDVNTLLISTGAPDPNGYTYPSEEAFANFLAQNPAVLTQPPQHIDRVILHWWSSGRAMSIYPEALPLFGPLYSGLVPVHHMLLPH